MENSTKFEALDRLDRIHMHNACFVDIVQLSKSGLHHLH